MDQCTLFQWKQCDSIRSCIFNIIYCIHSSLFRCTIQAAIKEIVHTSMAAHFLGEHSQSIAKPLQCPDYREENAPLLYYAAVISKF